MTLAEALNLAGRRLRAAAIDDARLEAEILLGHALNTRREALLGRLQEPLKPELHAAFAALLRRRLAHEPTAYIVGHKEFYGLELACTEAALIPRPESEMLVEYAIHWLGAAVAVGLSAPGLDDRGQIALARRPAVVDIGTGAGGLAVALAYHLPDTRTIAIDTSRPALDLARRNAASHGVANRIEFVQGTLLTPLRGRCDVILANLPYIPSQTYRKLALEIREHEPAGALRAGRRGTAVIEEMLAQAPPHLQPGGLLLAEHGWNQGARVRAAARAAFPRARIETRRDLAGLERMLVVEQYRHAASHC